MCVSFSPRFPGAFHLSFHNVGPLVPRGASAPPPAAGQQRPLRVQRGVQLERPRVLLQEVGLEL